MQAKGPLRKVFQMCWSLSDGSSKFIAIDEEANHQIVHAFVLEKQMRATYEPLDPGPQIDVFALDFLRVLLADVMLLGVDMPLVGPPSVGVKRVIPKGSNSSCSSRKTSSFRRPKTYANTVPVW